MNYFVNRLYRARNVLGFTAVVASLLCTGRYIAGVHAQGIDAGQTAPAKGGHVTFIADSQTLPANKPGTIQLHFRVENGFHINSHTPKSEMLIPTKLAVAETPDLTVSNVDFPAGTLFSFAFEPKEKLDVYQGDVVLTAHVKSAPGAHSLKGALRYQACDQAACYPPKTLAIEQPYTAK